jgi:hypothetical protein
LERQASGEAKFPETLEEAHEWARTVDELSRAKANKFKGGDSFNSFYASGGNRKYDRGNRGGGGGGRKSSGGHNNNNKPHHNKGQNQNNNNSGGGGKSGNNDSNKGNGYAKGNGSSNNHNNASNDKGNSSSKSKDKGNEDKAKGNGKSNNGNSKSSKSGNRNRNAISNAAIEEEPERNLISWSATGTTLVIEPTDKETLAVTAYDGDSSDDDDDEMLQFEYIKEEAPAVITSKVYLFDDDNKMPGLKGEFTDSDESEEESSERPTYDDIRRRKAFDDFHSRNIAEREANSRKHMTASPDEKPPAKKPTNVEPSRDADVKTSTRLKQRSYKISAEEFADSVVLRKFNAQDAQACEAWRRDHPTNGEWRECGCPICHESRWIAENVSLKYEDEGVAAYQRSFYRSETVRDISMSTNQSDSDDNHLGPVAGKPEESDDIKSTSTDSSYVDSMQKYPRANEGSSSAPIGERLKNV